MIITDTAGKKLRLTATRLTEIDHMSMDPFFIRLKDLGKPSKRIEIHNCAPALNQYSIGSMMVGVSKSRNKIGCRVFDKKTFGQIMKAGVAARRAARK